MESDNNNISQQIRLAKAQLAETGMDYTEPFKAFSASLMREIHEIKSLTARGEAVIPELDFSSLASAGLSEADRQRIKQRGCVIVRNSFPRAQAEQWNQQVGDYIDALGYLETPDKGLDRYFSSLQSGKPQIFSIYWSKPQVLARQHENLALIRRALNRLWKYEHQGVRVFDPDRECTYSDRARRREPGDNSLGLKPHIDGGSVERWLDSYRYPPIYRHLLSGDWEQYDPFDALYRTDTLQIASPAVCSMFRTFQGWTALSSQGPGDGTLQLIPSTRVLGWMYLRALQKDVPDDELCGAQPGRALHCNPEWHQPVLEGLCTIPRMHPGDSIWWHADLVHAVEDQHKGKGYSNVIYIGAAPYCDKNARFLAKQAQCFLAGESSPDFAAENYEVDFPGRAGPGDLTPLGRKQMGLDAW